MGLLLKIKIRTVLNLQQKPDRTAQRDGDSEFYDLQYINIE